ncbi:MAG: hypothetical protein ACRD9W_25425, partial [Terriglobia bacterium]
EQGSIRVKHQRIDRVPSAGIFNHRRTPRSDFTTCYAKIGAMWRVAAKAGKKIGVTLACNPLVPWWAILGSNQ